MLHHQTWLKDIRIGNWVCADRDQWGTVKAIGDTILVDHALITETYNPEQLSPIKVTLDMLSLCGFQIAGAGYRHKEFHLFLRYIDDGDLIMDIEGEPRKFSYVHQLQNLFIDLTGKLLAPNLYGN